MGWLKRMLGIKDNGGFDPLEFAGEVMIANAVMNKVFSSPKSEEATLKREKYKWEAEDMEELEELEERLSVAFKRLKRLRNEFADLADEFNEKDVDTYYSDALTEAVDGLDEVISNLEDVTDEE